MTAGIWQCDRISKGSQEKKLLEADGIIVPLVICPIEHIDAVKNLDKILKMPGIDWFAETSDWGAMAADIRAFKKQCAET